MTQEYLGNDRVAFADIDLSAAEPAEKPALKLSPTGTDLLIGKEETGGWPGHRYFNAATGLDGRAYPRKTAETKCHEMAHEENMREYIEKAAALRSTL